MRLFTETNQKFSSILTFLRLNFLFPFVCVIDENEMIFLHRLFFWSVWSCSSTAFGLDSPATVSVICINSLFFFQNLIGICSIFIILQPTLKRVVTAECLAVATAEADSTLTALTFITAEELVVDTVTSSHAIFIDRFMVHSKLYLKSFEFNAIRRCVWH